MTIKTEKALEKLAEGISEYRSLEASGERHLFLLRIITKGMEMIGEERPILVGGGAVEFYTCVRFATGDLDLVSPDVEGCISVLNALGFERAKKGRHFVNREIGALVDLHGDKLLSGEQTVEVVYRKVPLLLVSPEDCIAERLASFRRHGSTLDLINAFLVSYHHKNRLDYEHLQSRIGTLDLWDYYRAIQDIERRLILDEVGVDEAAGALIQITKEGPAPCAS